MISPLKKINFKKGILRLELYIALKYFNIRNSFFAFVMNLFLRFTIEI